MKIILMIVSFLGLILTVVPAFFVLYQQISWNTHANLMFIGMVLWFVSAPFLIKAD